MTRKQARFGQPAVYNATPPSLTDGDDSALNVDASGNLLISATLTTSDLAIGAVELKDGTTDARVTAKVDNTAAGTPTPLSVGGKYNSSAPVYDDGDQVTTQFDVNGNLKNVEQYAPVYEDNPNGKAVVEHRYTSSGVLTADTLVKTGAGLLHAIVVSCNDAAPTAGSVIVYDNTAESGTQIFNHTFTTTPFMPFSLLYDVTVATGLYVGFTTTADVNVTLIYR